jgi:hypothetical protein
MLNHKDRILSTGSLGSPVGPNQTCLHSNTVEENVAEATLGSFPDGKVVANADWTPAEGERVFLTPWGTDTGIGLLVTDAPLDATSVQYGWKGEPLQDAAALARQHYQAATGRVRLQ